MWTPIALFVLLATAASAEYGFKTGNEYKYEVTSKTLTSLQQVSEQYSGVLMRAELTVTPVKDDELIAYITKPEKAQIHITLPKGIETDIPHEVVQYTPFTLSKEPFLIRLKEGVVDELVVSKNLPVWEVNIIRSIVSQFQVDTQGMRVVPTKTNSIPHGDEDTAVYKVMEDTVEGECEVLYDVTPLPKYILANTPSLAPAYHLGEKEGLIEVMKTKNFSNCEQRPAYHFGFTGPTSWKPATNKMGNFLSRSSVSRVILSGSLKTYTIQSSVTTNKVIVSPELYNNQKGEVVSRMNVTLLSVQTGTPSAQGPQNPQTLKKLVYDFNGPFTTDAQVREKWEQRHEDLTPAQMRSTRSIDDKTLILNNEGWYQAKPEMTQAPETPFLPNFIGLSGHSIQHSKEVNVNQVVRKMAEQIGQQLQDQTHLNKEYTLEKFTVLTGIIRTMNVKQLEQTVQELYTPEKEGTPEVSGTQRNAWMVFRDALAQAGTGPALTTIVSLITSQKIKKEEAAQVVSVLPETARYPTTEYMNTFFELVKNPEIVSQHRLNTSVIYAFSKLVRLAQVDRKTIHNRYPVHTFGYLTRPDETVVTDTYIPYLAQELEHAVTERDSVKIQTYIIALGNIAHPKIVQVFEPYLEGKKPTTDYQRTLIVATLAKLAVVHPKLARSVLYKIYANTGEVYQVRVAAVYNLMKTNPPASMLQRMAQFTHEDPSYQVRSAVKSAIESAALLDNKENYELRQNAQSAVNILTPKVYGIQYSRLNLTDYLVKGLHVGYTQTFKYIGSEDSLIPKTFFYRVLGNINGFKTTLLKASGMLSSVQSLYEFLHETYGYDEQELPTEGPAGEYTVEKILKTLNLEHLPKEQIEGKLAFRFGGMRRVFLFDNHTLESLPEHVNKYIQMLTKGKVYNYQKFFSNIEVTLGLPTATGLPFVYTLNTPIYLGIKGKVQVNIPEIHVTQKGVQLPKTGSLTTNLELTYSTVRQGQISFVTPYDHQRYVAGYKKQVNLNLPVKGSLTVDISKRHYKLELKPVDTKRGDYKIFHYSTIPYTAIQSVTEFKPILQGTNTKVIEHKPVKQVNHHYGGKYLGMVFRVEGKTTKRNIDYKKIIYELIERHDLTSAKVYPFAETGIDNTHLDLYHDGKMSTTESLEIATTYRTVTPKEVKHETELGKVFTPNPDSQARIKQFYEETSAGIKGASVHVTDVELKVQGSTPIQYVGTIAFAGSPVDPQTKVLAYLHKTKGGENYEICYKKVIKDSYVSPYDFEKAIQGEPHSDVDVQLKFGEKCESGAKVTLTGKLERTPERREYVQTLPQVQKCKTEMQKGVKYTSNCRNATLEAGLLDKYSFTVKYDGLPETTKNVTYHLYTMLHHLGYPYVSESLNFGQTTPEKKIEVDVNYSPDLKTANVYLSGPTGVTQFRDVRVPRYVRKLTVVHPVTSVLQRLGWYTFNQQYKSYCTIDKTQTKTYDNQTYTTQLGNVWHVMTVTVPKTTPQGKLLTRNKELSVLVREGANNAKEVQIVFNYAKGPVVTILPGQDKPHVTLNGQQVTFDEKGYFEHRNQADKVVFKFYILPTGELKFVSPIYGLEFLYDQTRVQLALSHEYRNRVGGLCGVYSGEQFNYVTPTRYILQAPEEFAATWALTSEGHISELKKKAQQHSVYRKTLHYTTILGKDETTNYDHYESEEYEGPEQCLHPNCETKRIMVIERDGKHCFSVHPQIACKPGCQVEKTRTMKAEFVCVNKTQTSSHWAQMVARGAQPNFKGKGNAQKLEFEAPQMCVEG